MKKPISLLLALFPALCLALSPPKTNMYPLFLVLIIEAIVFFFVSSLIQAYIFKKRVIKILLINILSIVLGCIVFNILMNFLNLNNDVLSTLFSIATVIIGGSISIYYLLGEKNNFFKIICVFISANLVSIGLIYLSNGLVYKSVTYIYYNFLCKLFPSLPSF